MSIHLCFVSTVQVQKKVVNGLPKKIKHAQPTHVNFNVDGLGARTQFNKLASVISYFTCQINCQLSAEKITTS